MIIGPIAALSFDAIIGIVAVVIWLIMQGAAKRGGPNAPRQPPPSEPDVNDPMNPQDDLRRFFEELEKGIAKQSKPAGAEPSEIPQPPPIPTTQPRPVTQAQLQRKPTIRKQPAQVPAIPSRPVPVAAAVPAPAPASRDFSWNVQFPETKSSITTLRISDDNDSDRHNEISKQLHSRQKLRQMIVSAEILGKPIALRRTGQPLI